MRRALYAAVDPADIAFCRAQLGDLALFSGDLPGATAEYTAGLAADPGYQPLLRGRARVAAAAGDPAAALADAAAVAARTPTPDTLMEYAELLRLAGRTAEAVRQLTLAGAAHRIFVANGGRDDLTAALLALAAGDADAAVTAARAEWKRRPFAEVADVLGRALHAADRDAEALPYARRAAELGPRNASYAYHLAIVSLSAGRPREGPRGAGAGPRPQPLLLPRRRPDGRPGAVRIGGSAVRRPLVILVLAILGFVAWLGRRGERTPAGQLLGQPLRGADPVPRPGRRRGRRRPRGAADPSGRAGLLRRGRGRAGRDGRRHRPAVDRRGLLAGVRRRRGRAADQPAGVAGSPRRPRSGAPPR
nr:hypothetical protein GCM10020092_062590 [Actinoplanes digitatis]